MPFICQTDSFVSQRQRYNSLGEQKLKNMENDRAKLNKVKLLRTIDNKRTISSEQGHYPRRQHSRKFTLEYCEPKKPQRQPLMQRKNQSLPKTMAPGTTGNYNSNIRSRKLLYTVQPGCQEGRGSAKQLPVHKITNSINNKNSSIRSGLFIQAMDFYKSKQYSEACSKLVLLLKQFKQPPSEVSYYLGLCYWHLKQTDKAVLNLTKALDKEYQFQVQTYELLAEFYESTRNYNCALKTLDSWISCEPNPKAYLIRARIYYLFKEYPKALADYAECYQLEPTKLEAYIQQAEVVYKMSGIEAALDKYNQLLVSYTSIWPQSKHSDINYVKYKKSLMLLQEKSYEGALSLLQQVNNPELQSEVHYYIGIIHSIMNKCEESVLAFTKAIQANTSDKFVGQSYYEKFVIMFKKNDYYGIQHEIDMIGDKFGDNEALEVMRRVVEGVIFVLKMDFVEGVRVFDSLADNQCFQRNLRIYLNTIVSFKIFAYYSLHRFEQAYNQFALIKNKKMSDSNRYNYTMLKAIKFAHQHDFNEALSLFDEAELIEPFNNHTWMAKAIIEILFYNSLEADRNSTLAQNVNQEVLLSAEELLNRCLLKEPDNDKVLYVLAVINYELSQYESGLKLIRKAIDVSDDHTIKHYYLKANLKLMLGLQLEAINDYSNAIVVMNQQQATKQQDVQSTEQTPIPQCYLQRAKCYILDQAYDKAEADLRLFFGNLANVKKYRHQLELFMHVGCCNVILDIYKNILHEQYEPYQKMKCYYLSKELNSCLSMMNVMLEFQDEEEQDGSEGDSHGRVSYEKLAVDRDCLEALKKSSQGNQVFVREALSVFEGVLQKHEEGDIFKKSDCVFFAGVMSFFLEEYGKAKNYFIDAKGEKLLLNEIAVNEISGLDEENRLFSLQEINYNIGLCDYVQGKWSAYLDLYPEFKRQQGPSTEHLLDEDEEITPFQVKNRLCSIYQPCRVGSCSFRLSFCLPRIKLPEVKFHKSLGLIKGITLADIEMRPSAPWIQKSKKGIIFTTEVLKQSIDFKSEKSKKINRKKAQERYKEVEPA